MKLTQEKLYDFIKTASFHTYFGGGAREKNPERPGFTELIYSQGDLSYRDSYVGFYASHGMEIVRQNNKPIWASSYGGGMVRGQESKTLETFSFLVKAISQKEQYPVSFRGPQEFTEGKWRYTYHQKGEVNQFSGHEEISQEDELVFFHDIIGGLIVGKESV